MHANVSPPRRRGTLHRFVRQLHLWIGAWGALAAILYGATGLVLNHRMGEGAWPQGESRDTARVTLAIPASARATPEQLSLWLRHTRGLDAQLIRKGGPGGDGRPAPKWSLSGGNARQSWTLDYAPGSDRALLKYSQHSPLAALNRLHKAVGGGLPWRLLADSFAIGMLLLGLSGIWMWGRGRSARELVFSVMGLSTLVFAAVLALALG
ncbi:PepSY-associated TM helix domain-containing protein [Thermomonas alba]|uniref:PepSY-associated TM helix domain-containing protein n=1 Tax=Thermomonas alba TaxID=2888525 RepID=UPI001F034729|nr:PepSY-associated TM helix domain-containing protein [Thermomonas alba]